MLKALIDLTKEFDVLDDPRGKGFLLGVEVVKSKKSKEPNPNLGMKIKKTAYEKGLIIGLSRIRMKDAVINVFAPPLVTTQEQIDKALEIYRSAVKEARASA